MEEAPLTTEKHLSKRMCQVIIKQSRRLCLAERPLGSCANLCEHGLSNGVTLAMQHCMHGLWAIAC